MADNVLDIKDIKQIVEEGLQVTKKNWEDERSKDQKAFDDKVNNVIKTIEEKGYSSKEEVEKAVKGMQEQFDELATKMGDVSLNGGKKSFGEAIKAALKEGHDAIKNVDEIIGSKIIKLKDITYEDNFVGLDDYRTDRRPGIVGVNRDVFHMRDILPVGSTTSDTIKYVQEGEKTGDGPAPWERGATIEDTAPKPEFEPNLSSESAEVKWIAGLMRIPVEMLADLPFLTSYLQAFALQELLEVEDDQILNGNGNGPNLNGIIPNATAYSGNYTNLIEVLVDAGYGQLGNLNIAPTDVLLNPRNIVDIILNKAAGSGEYNLPGGSVGFVNGQLVVAGLNVHKTNKIDAGDFLIGNFNQAQLFQRQAPQLRFFEQDRDNVALNLVTARIEERVALAIYKTQAFIAGTFPAPTPEV